MIVRHPLAVAALILSASTQSLLAQRFTVPHGSSIGPSIGPIGPSLPPGPSLTPGPSLSPSLPEPALTPLTPSPSLSPPPPSISGSPPPPPVAQPRTRVPPYCVVSSADNWAPSGCSSRYISFNDLWRGLRACGDNDARCFASKLLAMAKEPVVVVYSRAEAAVQSDYLHREVAYAIAVMGDHLKTRVYNGAGNLPSISGIDDLVNRAKQQVNSIDVPLNETQDEQLKRLGLTPAMISLATNVANS